LGLFVIIDPEYPFFKGEFVNCELRKYFTNRKDSGWKKGIAGAIIMVQSALKI